MESHQIFHEYQLIDRLKKPMTLMILSYSVTCKNTRFIYFNEKTQHSRPV